MLDLISSKLAVIAAASIIAAAVIGVFASQSDNLKEAELDSTARRIAQGINEAAQIKAATNVTFTFNQNRDGIYIRPLSGGKPYTINITQNIVVLRQGASRAFAAIIVPVHLWAPDELAGGAGSGGSGAYVASSEVAALDVLHQSIEFESGRDFFLSQKIITVDGRQAYVAFCGAV